MAEIRNWNPISTHHLFGEEELQIIFCFKMRTSYCDSACPFIDNELFQFDHMEKTRDATLVSVRNERKIAQVLNVFRWNGKVVNLKSWKNKRVIKCKTVITSLYLFVYIPSWLKCQKEWIWSEWQRMDTLILHSTTGYFGPKLGTWILWSYSAHPDTLVLFSTPRYFDLRHEWFDLMQGTWIFCPRQSTWIL